MIVITLVVFKISSISINHSSFIIQMPNEYTINDKWLDGSKWSRMFTFTINSKSLKLFYCWVWFCVCWFCCVCCCCCCGDGRGLGILLNRSWISFFSSYVRHNSYSPKIVFDISCIFSIFTLISANHDFTSFCKITL